MTTKNPTDDYIRHSLPGQPSFTKTDDVPESPSPNPSPGTDAPDPFDPARYRLGTNYASLIGTETHLLEIPIRKPGKEAWFRVHRDFQMETALLEIGDETGDRETFLVDPPLWPRLASETTFGPRLLVVYLTKSRVLGLWPIKLPRDGEKISPWTRSAVAAVSIAETRWVRLQSDRALGAYRADTASGFSDDPVWPEYSFGEILKIAFRDRVISAWDHPILKQLRGDA